MAEKGDIPREELYKLIKKWWYETSNQANDKRV
jgi:hypothetical protein